MTVIEQQLSQEASRRRFLGALGGVAGLAALAQVPLAKGALASPAPASGNYPFSLGVASGDPSPDGFVLWTRLAPDPLAPRGGGMPPQAVASTTGSPQTRR